MLFLGGIMVRWIEFLNRIVWGVPLLILILGAGVFLSIKTGFFQLRFFPRAVRQFVSMLRPGDTEGVSSFQALCTALAATVGTGNLVGVAGAICLGGPGAIFWMWICALFGMMTKFAEAALSVRFRVKKGKEYVGGPMYLISRGMGGRWLWLASVYCFFGAVASFGVGNATQINSVIDSVNAALVYFGLQPGGIINPIIGATLAVVIAVMLLGGASRIGRAAERLVPFASAAYILLCIGAIACRAQNLPKAFEAIVKGAFSPSAVTGGLLGSAFQALRVGVSRGVFTNEAGMGTAGIAHASAEVSHPAEQGLMGIMEVFLDTVVICTLTALAILCSGIPIPYGTDAGGSLTVQAFVSVYGPWVSVFLALALCSFALATILGWSLYGMRCVQFLLGGRSRKPFVLLQAAVAVVTSVMNTGTIWLLAETVNGLMAIPNLIAIIVLCPVLKELTIQYKEKCSR